MMPSQRGRTAVVTGATSGLGFETALALARAGARVVLTARDAERGKSAAARIRAHAAGADLVVAPLDLADLASVRQFPDALPDGAVDILINNAGVMAVPFALTADGFESQFGVNHLGHFALTGRLLPRLQAATAARVVTVSSFLHKPGRIVPDDLAHPDAARYSAWGAYHASKLANLLFAYELDRRARAAGSRLLSIGAHPGYSATNLTSVGPQLSSDRLSGLVMHLGDLLIAQSAAAGALPQLYAATMPDVRGGDFYGPRGPRELRGSPRRTTSSAASYNVDLAADLWDLSIRLTGVKPVFEQA